MRQRTKALDIPACVKDAVCERDNRCCVLCGDSRAAPNAHYISRAQGGLGIAQNIVTLCEKCHRDYDQSENREFIRKELRFYLSGIYPDWNENELKYRKE